MNGAKLLISDEFLNRKKSGSDSLDSFWLRRVRSFEIADHRAQWNGFIKFGEVSCGGGLYTAASTSECISFQVLSI